MDIVTVAHDGAVEDLSARAERLDRELRALGADLATNAADRLVAANNVHRLTREARHALARMVAAAGLHPQAHTVEEA